VRAVRGKIREEAMRMLGGHKRRNMMRYRRRRGKSVGGDRQGAEEAEEVGRRGR